MDLVGQRIAKPPSRGFIQRVVKRAAGRIKNKAVGPRAVSMGLELRLVRYETTQILNEIGIKNKTERATIHRAVQEWKAAQVKSFYQTTMKSVSGEAAHTEYKRIASAFSEPRKFDLFIRRLIELTKQENETARCIIGQKLGIATTNFPKFGKN